MVIEAAGPTGADFVITNSGPAVSPRVQEAYSTASTLRAEAWPDAKRLEAAAVVEEIMARAGAGEPFEVARAWMQEPGRRDVIDELYALGALIPDTDALWAFTASIVDHDPRAALEQLRVPLLALLGGSDRVVPVDASAAAFRAFGATRSARAPDHHRRRPSLPVAERRGIRSGLSRDPHGVRRRAARVTHAARIVSPVYSPGMTRGCQTPKLPVRVRAAKKARAAKKTAARKARPVAKKARAVKKTAARKARPAAKKAKAAKKRVVKAAKRAPVTKAVKKTVKKAAKKTVRKTRVAKKTATRSPATKRSRSAGSSTDAIALLKQDHREVARLFAQFERAGDGATRTKERLVAEITTALSQHAAIEELVFYPAIRREVKGVTDDVLEALEEHHVVKFLLRELEGLDATDERFDAKTTVMIENVEHHVKEEEEDLFPKVRKRLGRARLADIGDELKAAKSTGSDPAASLRTRRAPGQCHRRWCRRGDRPRPHRRQEGRGSRA